MKFSKLAPLSISILLFISILNLESLTRPILISYEDGVISSRVEDGLIKIFFEEGVAKLKVFDTSAQDEKTVMAYNTKLSKILDYTINEGVINIRDTKRIFYEDGMFSGRDILLFGDELDEVTVSLPRLALNSYVVVSIFIYVICLVFFLTVKQERNKIIFKSIMVLSGSYIISSFIIKGMSGASYFFTRDLLYIIITSLALSNVFYQAMKKTSY